MLEIKQYRATEPGQTLRPSRYTGQARTSDRAAIQARTEPQTEPHYTGQDRTSDRATIQTRTEPHYTGQDCSDQLQTGVCVCVCVRPCGLYCRCSVVLYWWHILVLLLQSKHSVFERPVKTPSSTELWCNPIIWTWFRWLDWATWPASTMASSHEGPGQKDWSSDRDTEPGLNLRPWLPPQEDSQ